MKKVPLEEQKIILVDMLSSFDSFCRRNDIEYSVTWGTLIGAIRHQGFIPWDDDVDVMLDRKNYEKFLVLYKNSNEKYPLLSLRNDKRWCHTFSRIVDTSTKVVWTDNIQNRLEKHGLWIDIMAVDNVPEDSLYINASHNYQNYEKLGRISRAFYKHKGSLLKNLVLWIAHFVLHPFSGLFFNKAESIMQSYNNVCCERMYYWHLFWGGNTNSKPFISDYFTHGYIDAKFEGLSVRAIKEYDSYLRNVYGNYMELPPVEKRVSNHICDIYYV